VRVELGGVQAYLRKENEIGYYEPAHPEGEKEKDLGEENRTLPRKSGQAKIKVGQECEKRIGGCLRCFNAPGKNDAGRGSKNSGGGKSF